MTELVNQGTGEIGPAIDLDSSNELQVAPTAARELAEIQASMVLAKRFPRQYQTCWSKLMEACKRAALAKEAAYSFPRGKATVTGPSVNLARVAAQCYGNIRFGLDVLRDDDETILIRGWAWDIENNLKSTADDNFKKLIYRKKGGWQKPDERDLRELVNRRGAILKRNCLLEILPRDLVEDALGQCRKTLKSGIKDPKGEGKRLILSFQDYGVDVEMLNDYLGHDTWDADDIMKLTDVLNALKDGAAKRADYFEAGASKPEEPPKNGTLDPETMKAGDPADHQGHEAKEWSDDVTKPPPEKKEEEDF